MSETDALMGVAGAGLGFAGAVIGPAVTLAGFHYGAKFFDGGVNLATERMLPALKKTAMPATKAAGSWLAGKGKAAWTKGLPAIRSLDKVIARHPLLAGAAVLGGLYGLGAAIDGDATSAAGSTAMTAAGIGLGTAGIAGALYATRNWGGLAMAGAGIAGAAAFSAFQPKFKESQQAFINSSNAMMARGASNRNKNRGHY